MLKTRLRGYHFALLGIFAAALATLAGCAEMDQYMAAAQTLDNSRSRGSVYHAQTEPYNGPKARVTVMDFQNKTATGAAIGNGMKDQLVTALAQTGAFILLERENLKDVLREQDLGGSGRVNRDTAAPMGGIEGADFLIYGAVTEYEANQAGFDVGGGTAQPTNIGQVIAGAAMNQDHVAIDLRVVDAKTARIVAATTIQGRARDLSGAIDGQFSNVLVGTSGHYNTPIEKAVRACMIKASNWIADNTLRGGVMHVNQTQEDQPGPYTRRPEGRDERDSRSSGDRGGRYSRESNDGRTERKGSVSRVAPKMQNPAVNPAPAAVEPSAPAAPMVRPPVRPVTPPRAVQPPPRLAPRPGEAVRVPARPQLQAPAAPAVAAKPGAGAKLSVAAPEVLVTATPAAGGTVIGKLSQGQSPEVVERNAGYTRVRMPNGLLGWVPSSSLK